MIFRLEGVIEFWVIFVIGNSINIKNIFILRNWTPYKCVYFKKLLKNCAHNMWHYTCHNSLNENWISKLGLKRCIIWLSKFIQYELNSKSHIRNNNLSLIS
jgi:hypothetical protein